MALTQEEIARLAELARLEISPEENARAQKELERVLEYVGRLSKIDTAGVAETSGDAGQAPLRADEAVACDDVARELILSDFPDRAGDALRVPAVFEKPKG